MTDICENRHGGNPESVAAYRETSADERRALRERVYRYAVNKGPNGITADEVVAAAGMVHNRIAPRISELRKDGRLIETTRRRKTRLGRNARVLVADIYGSAQ